MDVKQSNVARGASDEGWKPGDGTLANDRMFFEGIDSGVIAEGVPDGMKCDEGGNIWVTGSGGVWVISGDGEHLGVVEVAENVGNLAWGGAD